MGFVKIILLVKILCLTVFAQTARDSAAGNEPLQTGENGSIKSSVEKISANSIIRNAYCFKVLQLGRIKTYDMHLFSRSSIRHHIIDDPVQLFTDYKGDKFNISGVSETEQFDYYKRYPGKKYYDKKIIITSRRQTEILNKLYAFPYSINMYEDEIYLLNAEIPGPLTEDCLDIYDYKLLGTDSSGGRKIYEVGIKEKLRFMPGFRGKLRIEDITFALIGVDLKTNYATNIPLVKDIRIREEFEDYTDSANTKYYLPKNFSLDISGSFIGVIKLRLQTYSETKNSKLNTGQKGVKYDDFNIVVKPDANQKPRQYWEENGLIENDTLVSKEMKKIYEQKLSGDPFVSFTGTGVRFGDNLTWNYLYSYMFNRIEGSHLELNVSYERDHGRFAFNPGIVYGTADDKTKGFLSIAALPTRNIALRLSGDLYSNLMPLFKKLGWFNYIENTIATLFTKKDRVDWYMGTGFRIGADYRLSNQITLSLEFQQEKSESVSNNTNYSFYRTYKDYSINPQVNNGMLRKVSAGIIFDFNRYRMIDWGDGDVARSRMTALPVLEFKYGYSGRKFTQSDFEFKEYLFKVTGSLQLHSMIKILYKFGANLKYGTVPYQELETLDPKFIGFPNDISFICPDYSEFLGDRVIFLN